MNKTNLKRPFFARFLEDQELQGATGGNSGGIPNSHAAELSGFLISQPASPAAFANNRNAGPVF